MSKARSSVTVVIPNWNGIDILGDCLDSLKQQTLAAKIIVVENGSKDGSLELLKSHYPEVEVIVHRKNKGFAGGVNAGIRSALKQGAEFVALLNNDATVDKQWLANLVADLRANEDTGIATSKIMSNGKIDSTGEEYTSWGLPYPRGRGEPVSDKYDDRIQILAASGGASLYRAKMLQEVGLFDEDYFAYYEDVDISLRAQLAGWKVRYVPEAVVEHKIGNTSGKIKDFTTYQTIKNLPLLLYKNLPIGVLIRILPKFMLAYCSFIVAAIWRGQTLAVLRGYYKMLFLLPKKTGQRILIQHKRKVTTQYVWDSMRHHLPPEARNLRRLIHPLHPDR